MKRTDNQSKFDALRKEFSTFVFEKQTVKKENGALHLAFDFNLDDRYHFRPTLEIPARPFFDWDRITEAQLETLAFQIGMTELVSYWKIACPKRVVVKPFALTEKQKAFWKKLYYNGLGEFLYLNSITVSEDDLMEIESPQLPMSFQQRTCDGMESMGSVRFEERTLVPIGGGKDSVVTMECLRNEMPVIPMIVNPRGATLNCVKTAGYKEDEFIVINRTLDPTMLKLNAEGYLNGHTPFSALLAFISILVAFGSRSKYIALSNENSANESTVPGTNINHQYSKSIEFESDFRNYVAENLSDEVQYFSFLRPLSELQIAKLFSQCEAYHPVFRSCNVGSKTDSWCGHCPKCLFTWIILSPFLSREKLTAIFGKDLMADASLQPILEELNGTAPVKPFECVGTVEEVRACLAATTEVPEPAVPEAPRRVEGPNHLDCFVPRNDAKRQSETKVPEPAVPEAPRRVEGPTVEEILNRFNTNHFLPEKFERILKNALFKPIDTLHPTPLDRNDMDRRLDKILNRLRGKRILILGFGREGRSTLAFLNKYLPDADVAVADKNAMEGVAHFGEGYLEAMFDYDIVIKTPGISLKDFDTKGVEITSQTDLFLSQFHEQTIGISGTKGKSTTTSLIYHLLKSSGRDAILTGNIGIPCFDVMEDIKPDSIVVYELSAHQLEYVHNSPHVGVLLNVFEEHLDHFGTMERYKAAKLNLLRFMGKDDIAVVHDTLLNDAHSVIANEVKQSKVFSLNDLDGFIDRTALPLKGEHNFLNVKAALLACDAYGVDYHELIPYLYTFKPLEHRLEPVGTFDGVAFVNDSISTIPQAAISACEALGRVDFLLLGGFDRGIDYQPLADYLKAHPVPYLLFTGKAGERMMSLIDGASTGSVTCKTKVPEPVEGPTHLDCFVPRNDAKRQSEIKVPEPVEGPTVEEILHRFNTNHFLPEKFERILKNALSNRQPIDSLHPIPLDRNDMDSRLDKILNRLRGKRILILGFGREGRSTLAFLNKYLPDADVAVADKNEMEAVQYFGPGYLEAMYDYDIVIKTPGISLKDFDTKGVEITSQTDLFLSQFHEQTIGISGTKGKSTTTSLIYHLLKSSGRDAILTGNIGIPCFDVMEDIKPDSIVVYELSAHQLEYVHNSPHVGVLLNVFEEHLDHFGTMERYKAAKLNLLRFMGKDDIAVVHDTLLNDAHSVIANEVKQSKVFSLNDLDKFIDRTALPLKGEHNFLNVKAALLACDAYGVDYHELIPYLYTFRPLEHRLEPVGTFDGVTFVNDSISTIPQAAISACEALGRVDFLLLGGFDRGIDYLPLVEYLKAHPVPYILFTGKAGERMMSSIDGASTGSATCKTKVHEPVEGPTQLDCFVPRNDAKRQSEIQVPEPVEGPVLSQYSSMEEAFAYIASHAKSGDVCLLSPAASSYDQYKNFEERGRKFKALAERFATIKKDE